MVGEEVGGEVAELEDPRENEEGREEHKDEEVDGAQQDRCTGSSRQESAVDDAAEGGGGGGAKGGSEWGGTEAHSSMQVQEKRFCSATQTYRNPKGSQLWVLHSAGLWSATSATTGCDGQKRL